MSIYGGKQGYSTRQADSFGDIFHTSQAPASIESKPDQLAVEPKNPAWDLADVEVWTRLKSACRATNNGNGLESRFLKDPRKRVLSYSGAKTLSPDPTPSSRPPGPSHGAPTRRPRARACPEPSPRRGKSRPQQEGNPRKKRGLRHFMCVEAMENTS